MSGPNRPWTKQPYAGSSSLTNEEESIAANLLSSQDGGCRHRGINCRHPSSSASKLSGRWPGIITERPAYAFLAVVFAIAAASLLQDDWDSTVVGFACTGVLVLLSLRSLRKTRRLSREMT
jgi:hypothetical protein